MYIPFYVSLSKFAACILNLFPVFIQFNEQVIMYNTLEYVYL